MTGDNQDYPTDDRFADVLGRLEGLAERLDAQRFPGQAWAVPRPRSARRWMWQVAASLAAAAAVVAVVVHYHGPPQPQVKPAEGTVPIFVAGRHKTGTVPFSAALARTPDVADDQADDDLADSEILFVEDLDSYSIIDLMGDVPLVSFATKDSYVPVCVVPLLPEPSS